MSKKRTLLIFVYKLIVKKESTKNQFILDQNKEKKYLGEDFRYNSIIF